MKYNGTHLLGLFTHKNKDLNLDPGKILTAGFRSLSRKFLDIGQYYHVINGSNQTIVEIPGCSRVL